MITKPSNNWIRSLFELSSSKKEAERRLAHMGLGVILALQNSEISLEEAQADLFNLKNYIALRKQKINRRLLELLEWGMELEDVADLAPHGLPESYERMIALARHIIRESLNKGKSANHKRNWPNSSKRRQTVAPSRKRNRTGPTAR
jgi:hypothetical protein